MLIVLVPVLDRPQNVRPLVESFLANSTDTSSLRFVVQENASKEQRNEINKCTNEAWLRMPDGASMRRVDNHVCPRHVTRWSQKLNFAYRVISNDHEYEHEPELCYLLGADDLRFHKGWDDNDRIQALLDDPSVGVIGTNDMGNPAVMEGRHSTHPIVKHSYVRDFGIMEAAGVIAPECYFHNFTDNEIVSIAKSRLIPHGAEMNLSRPTQIGAYAHCKESRVEHMHPAWGKAAKDDVYLLGDKRYAYDHALFTARKRLYGWT